MPSLLNWERTQGLKEAGFVERLTGSIRSTLLMALPGRI